MYKGFIRVSTAVPQIKVADCNFNVEKIVEIIDQVEKEQVQIVCFPELSITGYTCGDLFYNQTLMLGSEAALLSLLNYTKEKSVIVIVGMPVRLDAKIFNAALVLHQGEIKGIVPKTFLPNRNEYYEKRWFSPAEPCNREVQYLGNSVVFGTKILFKCGYCNFSVELCEDLWMPIPPSSQHCMHGSDIIFNLSASNESVGKTAYRKQLILQQSARTVSGYVYSSASVGESSTDLVFSGSSYIAENGILLKEGNRFSFNSQHITSEIDIDRLRHDRQQNTNFFKAASDEKYNCINLNGDNNNFDKLTRKIDKFPFVPSGEHYDENCEDIIMIQTHGLAKRWKHTSAEHLLLGVSGGLDSTLALLVCVKVADLLSYDRKRVIGITMPGFGTTARTHDNAIRLMKELGVTIEDISIKDACLQHFKDINHDFSKHDVVFENTQARERTQILMDIANKVNGLVVGTGDLSELALGWATYNGDHISMYGVNSGVPKTLVRHLIQWCMEKMNDNCKQLLFDILSTPVSPELLPANDDGLIVQKTEELLGPYELHDFFLYYFIRYGCSIDRIMFLAENAFGEEYSVEEIKKYLKIFMSRFFSQQFKRSCLPDGPKVGSINLSPRGDWRMPSDAEGFIV